MFCPKCGTPGKGKRFCTRCGLEQILPRYQGSPRNAAALTTARALSVAASDAATLKVIPAADTVLQRQAAAAQTNLLDEISVDAVSAPLLLVGHVTRKIATRKIANKPVKPQRKVAGLLAVALLLLLFGGFGFQQYKQQTAAAQAPVARRVEPAVTPAPALPQRWLVITEQTRQVSQAEAVLTEADQTPALIAPGGQLALELRAGDFFGNGPGADVQLHSAMQTPVSYTVFVRNDAASVWQRIDINRRGFVQGIKGHDMDHHGLQQARQLLIRNEANTALALDSVSVVYQDKIVNAPSHHHMH